MSEKLSHKNAIKDEKRKKRGPHRFSDNPKYPLKRIWPNPKNPPWISNYCASMTPVHYFIPWLYNGSEIFSKIKIQ
jgi:hypothetical protein